MEEYVKIPKSEYEALLKSSNKLARLEAYGVDNWSWYSEAINDVDGIFGEEEE
jgi:hypothetical protein